MADSVCEAGVANCATCGEILEVLGPKRSEEIEWIEKLTELGFMIPHDPLGVEYILLSALE
jgi:hypothetical protein